MTNKVDLKNNTDTQDFNKLTARDYDALVSSDMLNFFYPWAKGDSLGSDSARFADLAFSPEDEDILVDAVLDEKPGRKLLIDLTKTQHRVLSEFNVLQDLYPEATGDFANDTATKKIVKMYLHSSTDDNADQASELGLSGIATCEFLSALHEVEFDVEVDLKTGKTKILRVDSQDLL